MNEPSPTPKTIEAYIEELRRFQAAATPAAQSKPEPALRPQPTPRPEPMPLPEPPPAPTPPPAPNPLPQPQPMAPTPMPPIPPAQPGEPVYIPANEFRREQWNPTPEETGTGFLQIRVTSGRNAIPIAGARVIVSRPDEYANPNRLVMVSDIDGMTPFVSLPTVDKALSQVPGNIRPFSTYDIRTEAPQQLTVVNLHVPIFDEISSIQRVDMVGPEENYSGDGIVVFDDTNMPRINGQP